jgi:O-methyltransferase
MSKVKLIDYVTREGAVWRKFRHLTMNPRSRYIGNMALARRVLRKNPALREGSLVECGTWRGGSLFGLMSILSDIHEIHAYDSFEGLPPATELDGKDVLDQERNGGFWHNNNTASEAEFREGLAQVDLPHHTITVNKGWFEDTLPGLSSDRPIAILRLDGDWYDSTMTILTELYDKVMPGGLVIIDDYFDWDGCSRAVHDFLSARKAPEKIRQYKNLHLAYIIKSDSTPLSGDA